MWRRVENERSPLRLVQIDRKDGHQKYTRDFSISFKRIVGLVAHGPKVEGLVWGFWIWVFRDFAPNPSITEDFSNLHPPSVRGEALELLPLLACLSKDDSRIEPGFLHLKG